VQPIAPVTIYEPSARRRTSKPVPLSRVLIQVLGAGILIVTLVAFAGVFISRRIAAEEAVHDAARMTDLLADSVVQPALTDPMATRPTAATAGLDKLTRGRVLTNGVVRVKIWNAAGLIVYSDMTPLIGRTYPLDPSARQVLISPRTLAEVSNLTLPENVYERSRGKLLEVYRPIWTPNGTPLVFEAYFPYDLVSQRSGQLWRGFAGITLSSIVAVFVLLVPLLWALIDRARRAYESREALMQHAVDASQAERRRIAATLHDGAVQDLAAASFAVAASAQEAAARGDTATAEQLNEVAGTVRENMAGLRSLLVEIYPPSLRNAGLAAALRDVAHSETAHAATITVDVDEALADSLPEKVQESIFQIAQECLRNSAKHSHATTVSVSLARRGPDVVLDIADDGIGFDPTGVTATPEPGHLGATLLADAAARIDARLTVDTAPAEGTHWRLEVPVA
jgi:signal transduction histidine kinase